MKSKLKFNKNDLNNINQIVTDLEVVVQKASQKDINVAAAAIVKEQKTKAPVDTGALKGSLSYGKEGVGVYIESAMDYSSYVEFGTSKQKPQPYFFNPARVIFRDFAKKLESALNKSTE
jgi:HK97 gp10 family phage protein